MKLWNGKNSPEMDFKFGDLNAVRHALISKILPNRRSFLLCGMLHNIIIGSWE